MILYTLKFHFNQGALAAVETALMSGITYAIADYLSPGSGPLASVSAAVVMCGKAMDAGPKQAYKEGFNGSAGFLAAASGATAATMGLAAYVHP